MHLWVTSPFLFLLCSVLGVLCKGLFVLKYPKSSVTDCWDYGGLTCGPGVCEGVLVMLAA